MKSMARLRAPDTVVDIVETDPGCPVDTTQMGLSGWINEWMGGWVKG